MRHVNKTKLKREMFQIIDELHQKNKGFSGEEIDRDIKYAKKYAPRNNS